MNLVSHFGIGGMFNVIRSSEHEKYGKTHPAVFLTTAEALHTAPVNCLVFEDSFNGLIAAKAARMKCVAVPAENHFLNPKFDIADLKLRSLEQFNDARWEELCRL
jgi:mannitol-1-/sugar-/sorbitol-6-/2-deoxyglucose-6-phosphatase